jgi:hypothetical protein
MKILPEKIPHGAVLVPVAVQAPFAPRFDQPVAHQDLQHMPPEGSFSPSVEAILPKASQFQHIPQPCAQPAGAPLAWTTKLQPVHPQLNAVIDLFRHLPILGKKSDLSARFLHHHIDAACPFGLLAVVDFAQVEQGMLKEPAAAHPPVLDDPVIAVFLSVFYPFGFREEHESIVTAPQSLFNNQGLHHSAKRRETKDSPAVFAMKR